MAFASRAMHLRYDDETVVPAVGLFVRSQGTQSSLRMAITGGGINARCYSFRYPAAGGCATTVGRNP
jgi:hypothetical protein